MPTFVRTDKCDGCKGQDKTACMYICPHDLMKLDRDGSETGHAMRAFNQEPEQCWECYSCVKICPQQAIEARHYADVVPLGGSGAAPARFRLHHVDHQVPQWRAEALQVPDPHHPRGFHRLLRRQAQAQAGRHRSRVPSPMEQNGFRAGNPAELIRK
jgi:adenylylsulfate reductase subunit B